MASPDDDSTDSKEALITSHGRVVGNQSVSGNPSAATKCPQKETLQIPDHELMVTPIIELTGKVSDTDESPARSAYPEDDIELDLVEHDIKVCDICGDAGNEDLLATCSKCSDGAEHTYCMREMMDKIPDGDWLCEDCKLLEATENEDLDKVEIPHTIENDPFSKNESMAHDFASNLEKNDTSSEIERLNNTDDDANEVVNLVSNSTRKRCLDNTDCGPATKKPVLYSVAESEEAYILGKTTSISEESLQKDIDKSQIKHPTLMSNGPQVSTTNFNSMKSSDIPQFQRGFLSKSSSFSSAGSPKAKLLDESLCKKPKGSREQDTTEIKDNPVKSTGRSVSFKYPSQSKGKVLFFDGFTDNNIKSWKMKNRRKREEKNHLHLNSSSACIIEASSVPAAKINPLPSCNASKSNPKNISTSSEAYVELPSSSSRRIGTLVENVNVKDDMLSGIESPLKVSNEGEADIGVSRSPTITSHGEIFSNDPLPISTGSSKTMLKSIPSQVNKGIGESIPFSTGKGSRDNTHGDSKLKAAIEAAFLKKPGIYNRRKNLSNHSAQISELEVKSDTVADFESQAYLNNNVSTEEVHGSSTCTTIPLCDYIWQGSFEVHRNCKILDLFDGVQAHLSARASSKVVDIMCKVSNKLALKEVSQLSVWPNQFHHIGVKDDNIALYFFARDSECYEGHYKRLLDNLMMNNLALKGSFDGVELLIFPSSHLPEKSHCWNMLYFLWGVFRLSGKDVELTFLQKITSPSCNVVSQENPPSQVNYIPDSVNTVEYCINDKNAQASSHCVTQPQAMKSTLPVHEDIESNNSVFQYLPPSPVIPQNKITDCITSLEGSGEADIYCDWEGREKQKNGDSEMEKCGNGDRKEEKDGMFALEMMDKLNSSGGIDSIPNLELALGAAERKTPKNLTPSSFVSFTEKQGDGRNDETTSALSLSLSLLSSGCTLKP